MARTLLLVDESHVSLPQLKAMHAADQRRKHSLVAHGFRLPSALDNRPLTHGEFWERVPSAVLVVTPSRELTAQLRREVDGVGQVLLQPLVTIRREVADDVQAAGAEASEIDAVLVACSNYQRAYPAIAVELQQPPTRCV